MIQGAYIDNNSYRDEWELYDVVFSFVNYYDSSLDPNALAVSGIFYTIPTANDYVKTIFKRLFDVDFKTVGEPIYTDIITSGCTSPYAYCTDVCGSCGNHHRNRNNLANRCHNNLPRENNQIAVVWASRFGQFCDSINGVHTLLNDNNISYAAVLNKNPVVNFYHISGRTAAETESLMSCILLHEVAHIFGIEEVNENSSHEGEPGVQCVMEKVDEDGLLLLYNRTKNGGSPFCATCESDLMDYVADKYFEGN